MKGFLREKPIITFDPSSYKKQDWLKSEIVWHVENRGELSKSIRKITEFSSDVIEKNKKALSWYQKQDYPEQPNYDSLLETLIQYLNGNNICPIENIKIETLNGTQDYKLKEGNQLEKLMTNKALIFAAFPTQIEFCNLIASELEKKNVVPYYITQRDMDLQQIKEAGFNGIKYADFFRDISVSEKLNILKQIKEWYGTVNIDNLTGKFFVDSIISNSLICSALINLYEASLHVTAVKKILANYSPVVCFDTEAKNTLSRTVDHLCNIQNRSFMTFEHGVNCELFLSFTGRSLKGKIGVMGEYSRRNLLSAGVDKKQIAELGLLRPLKNAKPMKKSELFEHLKMDPEKELVLYTPQKIFLKDGKERQEQCLKDVLSATEDINCNLIIKIHPDDDIIFYKKIINSDYSLRKNITIVQDLGLNESLLINSSLVIAMWSTLVLEAIMYNVPVIQVNKYDYPIMIDFSDDNNISAVKNEKELKEQLIKWSETENNARIDNESRQKFIKEYIGYDDGENLNRHVEYLTKSVNEILEKNGVCRKMPSGFDLDDICKKIFKDVRGRSRPDKSFPPLIPLFEDLPDGTRIFDVGCGIGSYGYIIQKRFDYKKFKISGLEINKDYLDNSEYISVYEKIVIGNILDRIDEVLNENDLFLFIDILEHLDKEDAVKLIKKIREEGKHIIASIPNGPKHWDMDTDRNEWDAVIENPYEQHRHAWTNDEIYCDLGLEHIADCDSIGVFASNSILKNERPINKILKHVKKVSLETTNFCQLKGAHKKCPLHITGKTSHVLPMPIVMDVLEFLVANDYQEKILFSVYNEVLLDPRLVYFLSYLKEKGSKAKVSLLTNGMNLTQTLLDDLAEFNVYEIIVTAYSESVSKNIKRLFSKKTKIVVVDRPQDNLDSRINIYENEAVFSNEPCFAPLDEIVVGVDGRVYLCCLGLEQTVLVC